MIYQELEFLADSSVIKPDQLNAILAQLPTETDARTAAARQNQTPPSPLQTQPQPQPIQAQPPPAPYSPPVTQTSNVSLNEKAPVYNQYATPPPQAPPAYPQAASAPSLGFASAMWAYTPTDEGDLALAPNDRIVVLEHMNVDCMFGERGLQQESRANMRMQGGAVATSVPAQKVSSLKVMSSRWRRREASIRRLRLPITGICLWLLARAGLAQLPMNQSRRANLSRMARSLARNWAMRVCSSVCSSTLTKKLTKVIAIFGAGATVGSNIVNSIF